MLMLVKLFEKNLDSAGISKNKIEGYTSNPVAPEDFKVERKSFDYNNAEDILEVKEYSYEDCKKNTDKNGINVFRVDGINDYTFLGYFADSRNSYLDKYKDSYFHMHDILDDENIIIKYTVNLNGG